MSDKRQLDDRDLQKVDGGIKITDKKLLEKLKELIQRIINQINNK